MSVEPSHQPITGIESRTSQSEFPLRRNGLLADRLLGRFAGSIAQMRRRYFVRSSYAVVLGAGQQADQIRRSLEVSTRPGKFQISGFVALQNEATCVPRELVFHSKDVTALLREHRSNVLIVAPDGQLRGPEIQQILDCKLRGVKMICASGAIES